VNEMGQFLWLEERLPDLPLLAIFAAFSLDPRPDFLFNSTGMRRAAFSDFLKTETYVEFRRNLAASTGRLAFHWSE
jgi:hypothetical protein